VAADDLSMPLGRDKKHKRVRFPIAIPVAGVLCLCIALFIGWAAIVDDPLGGEPVAVVPTDASNSAPNKGDGSRASTANSVTAKNLDSQGAREFAKPGASAGAPPDVDKSAGIQTVTIIDGTSGKRQEISIPATARSAAVDPRLLESTRHGAVPRIGPDGARASVVYARPASSASSNAGSARIAILVKGLGIGASSTAEALDKLPGIVTFAFAPYGSDLDRLVARARGEGHEVLLQIPMEPFDYPDNDPGPQTLLTSLAPEQNIDRLHWLMSRFQGYVGLANYMGARLTATETALAPVLREATKRGLLYVDDGSSPRSLAGQIAAANNLPFAKANVVLDVVPSQPEIDRALTRLENLARAKGIAVGVASALPLSIERLAQWAKTVERRGFTLVPISAVAMKAKSS
jgi:polysaccharide deacetylase 2 family uncharacterized protein YibQ